MACPGRSMEPPTKAKGGGWPPFAFVGWKPPPATLRRSFVPRPLLPSGPGGVDGLTTRRDRQGPPQKGSLRQNLQLVTLWRLPPVAESGGARGIRTLETGLSRLHTFQACSFNRSDIAPLSARSIHVRDRPSQPAMLTVAGSGCQGVAFLGFLWACIKVVKQRPTGPVAHPVGARAQHDLREPNANTNSNTHIRFRHTPGLDRFWCYR